MLFEVYNLDNKLSSKDWHSFIFKIYSKILHFDSFDLDIRIEQPTLKFFLNYKNNLTLLSNDLFPFILKQEDYKEEDNYPKKDKSIFFLTIHESDNILKIAEREEFKKQRKLFRVIFKFTKLVGFYSCNVKFYFKDFIGRVCVKEKTYYGFKPFSLLDLDLTQNVNYKIKSVPLYLKLTKTSHLFNDNKDMGFLEVLGFPYIPKQTYFPLTSFDFAKHTLNVGQTGTGKSKMIELFVRQLIKNNEFKDYSVIILDPHASIYSEFTTLSANIDFYRNSCSLFSSTTDINISTELTILLFKTVIKDQFNPKMERVLKYTLHVLYQTGMMSISNLSRFLTNLEFQKTVLQKLPPSSEQFKEFFGTDFVELTTKSYELAIMPIILLLDELKFLPFANEQSSFPLENFINDNNITFLSLNKIILGDKATKLLAGLLIQQIFTLAQARAFKKKVIFIIDEVSVVENDSLSAILSEARKYDLSLFLTQQYLTQVSDSLLKSILTNVYNYYIFKVSEQDASLLAKNLEMEFADEILEDGKSKGFKEEDLKIKMFNQLDPRQCLVRIYSGGKFLPCFKARTLDVVALGIKKDITPVINSVQQIEIKSTLPIDPNNIPVIKEEPQKVVPTIPVTKDPFEALYNEKKESTEASNLTSLLGFKTTQQIEEIPKDNINISKELCTLLQQLSKPIDLRTNGPNRSSNNEI